MSLETITQYPASVNPGSIPPPIVGSDCPPPGKAERAALEAAARSAGHAVGASVAEGHRILANRRIKSSHTGTVCRLQGAAAVDWSADRYSARQPAVILTGLERERLRSMRGTAAMCGTRVVAVRRGEFRGGRVTETRLLVATSCGNRICPRCDARRRRREAVRVEGRWRRIVTLGIPSSAVSAGNAWRRVSRWVERLVTAMRSAFRRGDLEAVRVGRKERRAVERENRALDAGERALPVLQYAWCLEPHESGYPHVHLVTNAGFVGTKWIKEQWSRITGMLIKFAGNQAVRNVSDTCAYLAKYISKTWFTDDIAAVLYRKRQWASTRKDTLKKPKQWTQEVEGAHGNFAAELQDPKTSAKASGWKLESDKPGRYAMMTRVWSLDQWKEYSWWKASGANMYGNMSLSQCEEYDAIEDGSRSRFRAGLMRMTLDAPLEDFWKTGDRRMIDWERHARNTSKEEGYAR